MNAKLGRAPDQKKALVRNQASYLLWYGKIETTQARAKSIQSYAEKLITLAVNTHEDIVKVPVTKTDDKGKEITLERIQDGVKKLNARRKIMAKTYDIPEVRQQGEKRSEFSARTKNVQHPLIEKIFNEIAPRYAARKEETGQGGGYTRIVKIGKRRGDNADMVIIELI